MIYNIIRKCTAMMEDLKYTIHPTMMQFYNAYKHWFWKTFRHTRLTRGFYKYLDISILWYIHFMQNHLSFLFQSQRRCCQIMSWWMAGNMTVIIAVGNSCSVIIPYFKHNCWIPIINLVKFHTKENKLFLCRSFYIHIGIFVESFT